MSEINQGQKSATEGIPADEKGFAKWLDESRATLNPEQLERAEIVKLSFNTVKMNKGNPDALAQAQRYHQQDVEKLKALLAG